MGLHKWQQTGPRGRLAAIAHWQVAMVLAAVSILVATLGDPGQELLRYDRPAIQDGEYWRLVSGHFAHLGSSHLWLNLAGLVLSWMLVGKNYSTTQWTLVVLVSIAAISGGFWFVDTAMMWYVGLSGVLHGILIAGALQGLRTAPLESALICALIVGKLAFEQLAGPLPGSESVSGGEVAVNSHLFGAIGGAVAAAAIWHRATVAPSL